MKEGLKKEGGKDPGPAVLQNPLLVSCWPELGHRTTPGCKEGWEAVCPAKNQEIDQLQILDPCDCLLTLIMVIFAMRKKVLIYIVKFYSF